MLKQFARSSGESVGPHAVGGAVSCLAFSPNGTMLASADYSSLLVLWDPRTGQLKWTHKREQGKVNAVAFSPDSTLLAISGELGMTRLFRVDPVGPASDSELSPTTAQSSESAAK